MEEFGGIRRPPTISDQIKYNFKLLEDGLWKPLQEHITTLNGADNPQAEREAAHFLAEHLKGIGPKQSRNMLQGLGVTKYEIPVDSRITKWLNSNVLRFKLNAALLSDHTYYDMASDGVQQLCEKAKILPCLLDAAIFTSFDGGWEAADLASETLENA